MAKVLLLDEEMTIVQMVGELVRSEGHQVVPFTSGQTALDRLSGIAPELIIANAGSEKTWNAILGVLQAARALTPPALLISITNGQSGASTLEAIRRGAYDYLTKPFTLHELKLRVQRALAYQATLSENVALRRQLHSKAQFKEIIGTSPSLREALSVLEREADSTNCLLIAGPKGGGKELIARTIHFKSSRRLAPFVQIHCGELPESRLETELFGERKVLTTDEQPGLIREADGGTLFLEEVNALPLASQARLLDLLNTRQITVPGETVALRWDVRVLAATQNPLERCVDAGTFLRDLFCRLTEARIFLPALRERAEDIPLLLSHFLDGRTHRGTGRIFSIAREAIEICTQYSWPGNVRELEQAVEQACKVSQDGVIQISDLPRAVQQMQAVAPTVPVPERRELQSERAECSTRLKFAEAKAPPAANGSELPLELVPLKQFLRNQELSYLQRTLAHVGGSKEKAAEVLGISLATMYRKLSEPSGALESE